MSVDPSESTDLVEEALDQHAALERELSDWVALLGLPPLDAPVGAIPQREPDLAAEEQLRALGYIE